jgi:hypothetical protein
MTDVLDRLDLEPIADEPPARPSGDDGRPIRTAVAALAVGAAAIHVAMAPPHVGDSVVLGVGFLAAAWAQVTAAWLAVTRPGRRLWVGIVALNVALLAVWAVSRTAGLPFGEHAGHPESVNIVDLTCVALEVAALLIVLRLLLLRPSAMRRTVARLVGVGIPVIALLAASVALASPEARTHAHGDHEHGTTIDPKLTAKGFGSFMNGHAHSHVEVVLDPATQKELDRELAITRDVAKEFPTLQDAVDAGYRRAGPYVPGLGLHMVKFTGAEYLNLDGVMDDEDLRHPLSLLYGGTDPGAELGGFMYYAATATEPAGFPGRNDGWHFHENLCAVDAGDGLFDFPFGPDFGATKAQCDGVGGNLIDSQWMVHVWTVPGWDDMAAYGGVFAEMNPGFACSDGTWFSLPFTEWGEHPLNTCRSGAAGQPEL